VFKKVKKKNQQKTPGAISRRKKREKKRGRGKKEKEKERGKENREGWSLTKKNHLQMSQT